MISDNRQIATILHRLIDRQAIDPSEIDKAFVYFQSINSPVDKTTFGRVIHNLQQNLHLQTELIDIAEKWRKQFENKQISSQKSQEFIELFMRYHNPKALLEQPLTVGHSRHEKGGLYDRIIRYPTDRWKILYTREGMASARIGGKHYVLKPGDLLLFEPNAVYAYQRHDSVQHWDYYWVYFRAASHWRSWFADSNGIQRNPVSSHIEKRGVFEQLLEQLLEAYSSPSAIKYELEANLLEQLLIRYREAAPKDKNTTLDPRISQAQDFILEHYNQAISVEDIAKQVSISASRLANLFKQQTGVSVLRWRDEKRISKAAQLLRESKQSIAKIGSDVGYSDAPYFTRMFRKYVGYSPREYRGSKSLS